MRFKADEIVSVISDEIRNYQTKLDTREVGRVLEIGDGIARVHGLSAAMAGEMVEFSRTGTRGLVDAEHVGTRCPRGPLSTPVRRAGAPPRRTTCATLGARPADKPPRAPDEPSVRDEAIDTGAPHPDGEHPKAKHELFECCIEIITGICTTVPEARADLAATLAEVRAAAERRGLTVICSGSHPTSSWSDQNVTPNPRYARLVDEMQWMARRLQIFGVHVHVGVRSPEKAVAIANALAAYIPHFLALSASSPFWECHDTGLASARSKVFEGLPTAGLPAPIESWSDFEMYMGTLVSAEAISTVREVWWDIRPHPDFGTVEVQPDGGAVVAHPCWPSGISMAYIDDSYGQ